MKEDLEKYLAESAAKRDKEFRVNGITIQEASDFLCEPVKKDSDEELVQYSNNWDRLWLSVAKLEPDAVEVLGYIAERLVKGRAAYGDLNLDADKRDWDDELRQEWADGLFYLAAGAIVRGRKK